MTFPVDVTLVADYVFLKLNGDPTGSYSQTQLQGSGTAAASSGSSTGIAYIPISVTTNSTSTTIPELFTTDIFSYAGSTNKTLLATSAQDQNGSGYVTATTGLYRSTSAITIISLGLFNGSNFSTGTIATLWGI